MVWELESCNRINTNSFFYIYNILCKTKKIDWRSFGLTEAFIISLFTEMFGIPLTIYVISSLLNIDIIPNRLTGHLLATTLAILGILNLEVGVTIVMSISTIMIIIGLILLIGGWKQIYKYKNSIAVVGFYSVVRHPQYLGLMIIMTAFIIQWPTIPTLIMYPLLMYAYYKQALKEENELILKFGELYITYASHVPRFNIIKGIRYYLTKKQYSSN